MADDIERTLYHYTSELGLRGILAENSLRPSLRAAHPNDARYGDGQYLSDVVPGTLDSKRLARRLVFTPFLWRRFTHFIAIDVRGLHVVEGRPGIFVIPANEALDLTNRIISTGRNLL